MLHGLYLGFFLHVNNVSKRFEVCIYPTEQTIKETTSEILIRGITPIFSSRFNMVTAQLSIKDLTLLIVHGASMSSCNCNVFS